MRAPPLPSPWMLLGQQKVGLLNTAPKLPPAIRRFFLFKAVAYLWWCWCLHNACGNSHLTSCCLRQPVHTVIPSLYLRPQAQKVLPPTLTSFVLLLALFSLLRSPCYLSNFLDSLIKIFPQNPFPSCPTGGTGLLPCRAPTYL